jgi:thymidylate synthase
MNSIHIEARDLPDAWHQLIYKAIDEAKVYKIDRGSYTGSERLEFDWITVNIKHPGTQPLIPKISERWAIPDPVEEGYIDDYLPYLMTGEMKPGESYTYGQRICKYPVDYSTVGFYSAGPNKDIYIQEPDAWKACIDQDRHGYTYLNQMDLVIWSYKNKGHRNNQMVLQVAHPSDMLLQDPPCLRQIDTRIQDGKLHFFPHFRSWDLFNGFPANLAAIQMMKEYMASEIGVEDGEILASSKGLHLYTYAFDMVKMIAMKEEHILNKGK